MNTKNNSNIKNPAYTNENPSLEEATSTKTNPVAKKNNSIEKNFLKYVSQNIVGTLAISAYVLADSLFIAYGEGADGMAALNLVLPVYSLIFAIGSMIALGSATRFKIYKAQNHKHADLPFSNAVFWALLLGLAGVFAGILIPDHIVRFMGGDERILELGTPYTRIFLLFTPFFMLNYIFNAFVRNDGNPSLAMIATLASNLFNIVMDYVFMFPCGLGMAGAALATAISPVVGSSICCMHLFSKKSSIHFTWRLPSFRLLIQSCQLGISAFIGEISSGVATMAFNFLILGIAGNVGIAAYGVVANTAIVATSIFNGISQGAQPLLSDCYGRGQKSSIRKILKLSILTALAGALLIVLLANTIPDQLVQIFNRENNPQMAAYAITGTRIYFIGFLFAGFNIVGMGYLSATEHAGLAFVTSIFRGIVAILLCAVILAKLFAMTGVWLAFPVAELLSALLMIYAILTSLKKER